jgi:hypothetical protein
MSAYDRTARCCAWCYAVGDDDLKKCGKCGTRPYCSRDCQRKDWKMGHHKLWCGKAGEKGVDFDVRPAGEKGLGLFVNRDFQRGEKILVERSAVVDGIYAENPSLMTAIMALSPSGASLSVKLNINSVEINPGPREGSSSGVFLTFSCVNHDCIGNSMHHFDKLLGLEVLVANAFLPAETEVTFSYVSNSDTRERAFRLSLRGFECCCRACHEPELGSKLDQMLELDAQILTLGRESKTEQAIRAVAALLELYDELRSSDMSYSRTHYDMFQICILKLKTVKEGMAHIQKAFDHALIFYGDHAEIVRKYKELVERPQIHRNYRAIN